MRGEETDIRGVADEGLDMYDGELERAFKPASALEIVLSKPWNAPVVEGYGKSESVVSIFIDCGGLDFFFFVDELTMFGFCLN